MIRFDSDKPRAKKRARDDDEDYIPPGAKKTYHSTSSKKEDEFTIAFASFKRKSLQVTRKSLSLAAQINAHTKNLKAHDEERKKTWDTLRVLRNQQEPFMNSVDFLTFAYPRHKEDYDTLKLKRDAANAVLSAASVKAREYFKGRMNKGPYS